MTDKEKLVKIKSLADKMTDTAFNMTTDASLLKKAMDEYHQFIINEYHKEEQIIKELQEEPVSEELEEASFDYADACKYDGGEKLLCVEHFKAGAKWQEKKDLETIETAIHHAYHNGRLEMKEQMMTNVTEVTVHIDAGGYPRIPQIELYDYDKDIPLAKEGDKYKVILIKED